MRTRIAWIIVLIWCTARCAIAQTQDPSPYDAMEKLYASYTTPGDPLGFPMKVRSLAANPYKFWRGSRELFWEWCGSNCRDWMTDADAVMTCHGDPHFGNIGSYASGEGFGKLAFGMVDFDDSHRLPFQYELLQGIVTLRLVADAKHLEISDGLIVEVLKNYRSSTESGKDATSLLRDDPVARPLLESTKDYRDVLEQYTASGRFRPGILDKAGETKEILRPAMSRGDELIDVLVAAMEHSPAVKGRFRISDRASLRAALKDAVQRTRLGSSGSQGLKKYFLLLDHPLVGVDSDVILYLKQQIPSAADRAGLATRDSRIPAERCAADIAELVHPAPFLSGWSATANGESYWVSLFEPWGGELDAGDVQSEQDLRAFARIWAISTGATHTAQAKVIAARISPDLAHLLRIRSDSYIQQLSREFGEFRADPRVGILMKTKPN